MIDLELSEKDAKNLLEAVRSAICEAQINKMISHEVGLTVLEAGFVERIFAYEDVERVLLSQYPVFFGGISPSPLSQKNGCTPVR